MSTISTTLQDMTNLFDFNQYDTRPDEWKNLPDDQTSDCGVPLGLVHPEIYDENNQLREREWKPLFDTDG